MQRITNKHRDKDGKISDEWMEHLENLRARQEQEREQKIDELIKKKEEPQITWLQRHNLVEKKGLELNEKFEENNKHFLKQIREANKE